MIRDHDEHNSQAHKQYSRGYATPIFPAGHSKWPRWQEDHRKAAVREKDLNDTCKKFAANTHARRRAQGIPPLSPTTRLISVYSRLNRLGPSSEMQRVTLNLPNAMHMHDKVRA